MSTPSQSTNSSPSQREGQEHPTYEREGEGQEEGHDQVENGNEREGEGEEEEGKQQTTDIEGGEGEGEREGGEGEAEGERAAEDDTDSSLLRSLDALSSDLFSDIPLSSALDPRVSRHQSDLLHAEMEMVKENYKLDVMHDEAAGGGVSFSALEFEAEVDEQVVLVSSVELSAVQQQEAAIERARVERLKGEQERHAARIEQLKRAEVEARGRLSDEYEALQKELRRNDRTIAEQDERWKGEQTRAFAKAEEALTSIVNEQKAASLAAYGLLLPSHPILPDGRPRLSDSPLQRSVPRLLRVKIHSLRAVKNKLPGGEYMIMMTLFDRLGGHPLRWCRLKDSAGYSHTAHTERSIRHSGKFFDLEMRPSRENGRLFLACPSFRDVRMSNVIIVEVFACRSGLNMTAQSSEGKGGAGKIMGNMAGSSNWSNIGSNALFGAPAGGVRQSTLGANKRRRLHENVIAWGAFPLSYLNKSLIEGKWKIPLLRGEYDPHIDKYSHIEKILKNNLDHWLCNIYIETSVVPTTGHFDKLGRLISVAYNVNNELKPIKVEKNENTYVKSFNKSSSSSSSSSTPSSGVMTTAYRFLSRGSSVTKSSRSAQVQAIVDNLSLDSKELVQAQEQQRQQLSRERAKELRQYRHSVTNVESDEPVNQLKEKMQFLYAELTADIGYSTGYTIEFWSIVCLFILTWWLRIYIHYFGQWVYLNNWLGIHVFEMIISSYTVQLNYVLDPSILILYSAQILISGPAFCLLVYAVLLVFTWTLRVLFYLPDPYYRFMLMMGINVMINPLSILLVDIIRGAWTTGDNFLLYNAFQSLEGLGWAGIIFTLLLQAICIVIGLLLLLIYVLNVHMNGRMTDIYTRLHAEEHQLFVPHDLEVSARVLRFIIDKSKQKKPGLFGTVRKVMCTSFNVLDHADSSYIDKVIHLSIYNVTPAQGAKAEQLELYRQFVRNSAGIIIEAFEHVESMGAEQMRQIQEQMLYEKNKRLQEKEEEEKEQRMKEEQQMQNIIKKQLADKEAERLAELQSQAARSPRREKKERKKKREEEEDSESKEQTDSALPSPRGEPVIIAVSAADEEEKEEEQGLPPPSSLPSDGSGASVEMAVRSISGREKKGHHHVISTGEVSLRSQTSDADLLSVMAPVGGEEKEEKERDEGGAREEVKSDDEEKQEEKSRSRREKEVEMLTTFPHGSAEEAEKIREEERSITKEERSRREEERSKKYEEEKDFDEEGPTLNTYQQQPEEQQQEPQHQEEEQEIKEREDQREGGGEEERGEEHYEAEERRDEVEERGDPSLHRIEREEETVAEEERHEEAAAPLPQETSEETVAEQQPLREEEKGDAAPPAAEESAPSVSIVIDAPPPSSSEEAGASAEEIAALKRAKKQQKILEKQQKMQRIKEKQERMAAKAAAAAAAAEQQPQQEEPPAEHAEDEGH